MKKFLIVLQLTLAIAFWLRLELSLLPYLFLIPYFLTGMFATLFVAGRKPELAFGHKVAIGAIAGYVLGLGFLPVFPQAFATSFTSLGWSFGLLTFAVVFFEDEVKAGPPFSRFESRYRADGHAGKKQQPVTGHVAGSLAMLRAKFGGKSFGRGLYRIFTSQQAAEAEQRVLAAYPDMRGRIDVFAFDWLNRIHALDKSRQRDGEPLVMMFSQLSDEVLEGPVGLVDFHDQVLVDIGDELLDAALFQKFLKTQRMKQLGWNQVVSMKQPLGLGGTFEVANFDIADPDVAWELNRQILEQTRDLPPGTPIGSIKVE